MPTYRCPIAGCANARHPDHLMCRGHWRQLSLPMPAQRRRHRPEPLALWHGVVVLRRLGKRVYRAGRHHKVDGSLLSNDQLNRLVVAEVAAAKSERIAELCQP